MAEHPRAQADGYPEIVGLEDLMATTAMPPWTRLVSGAVFSPAGWWLECAWDHIATLAAAEGVDYMRVHFGQQSVHTFEGSDERALSSLWFLFGWGLSDLERQEAQEHEEWVEACRRRLLCVLHEARR